MQAQPEDAPSRPFLAAIERRLTRQAFETWFRPLRITRSQSEGLLRISVPNSAVRDWILSQYSEALEQSLVESLNDSATDLTPDDFQRYRNLARGRDAR